MEKRIRWLVNLSLLACVWLIVASCACSALPNHAWDVALEVNAGTRRGFLIGASEDESASLLFTSANELGSGAYIREYHQQDAGWSGPTGFYGIHIAPSIPPGGNATWSPLYLWVQDYTLVAPYRINVDVLPLRGDLPFPHVVGHLVLDQIPDGANWDGPTDFWINLWQTSTLTLPTATVTDPLQGTRMHLTVYAPPIVPEPSSLAALGMAIAGVCGPALRRR